MRIGGFTILPTAIAVNNVNFPWDESILFMSYCGLLFLFYGVFFKCEFKKKCFIGYCWIWIVKRRENCTDGFLVRWCLYCGWKCPIMFSKWTPIKAHLHVSAFTSGHMLSKTNSLPLLFKQIARKSFYYDP